ncbi:hypothetical protein SAMD00023353_0900090 [Rosellinia necatrix]|uniref:Uncharacterized protein n=1 Tax=Rosellinia necatrix TaxID=77044 RepID=A0A1S8A641_ROSNE|nr:hypothetical protein SAMD00023353_0900090 [Rosellinia necatrix]
MSSASGFRSITGSWDDLRLDAQKNTKCRIPSTFRPDQSGLSREYKTEAALHMAFYPGLGRFYFADPQTISEAELTGIYGY